MATKIGDRTMKALVVTAINKAELIEWPMPQAGENDVVVKTHYSGVSIGTEMWSATGQRADFGTPPFINGYQATGEVVEIGGKVQGIGVGDQVVTFCSGAHAAYIKAGWYYKLPDPGTAKACALFVMPGVGANALNLAHVNTGETVMVIGQGLIGQCTAQLARLRGAYVIASEISPQRAAISRKYCADWVIDPSQGAVSDQLKQRFPDGADVVIESTGFQALLDDAIKCVRSGKFVGAGGRFVFEGWYPGSVAYNFQAAHVRQIQAFFPCFIGPPPSREGVIRLIVSRSLNIEALISHLAPWQESADIYNRLFTKERNEFNGIVFDWRTA